MSEHADLADARLPTIAEQHRCLWLRLLNEIAVVETARNTELSIVGIEGATGAKIHRTGEASLDHVRRRILVNVHPGHQFSGHIVEAQSAGVPCGENVATVELTSHLSQTADEHAAAFRGEAIGVAWLEHSIDRDSRHALQRFGDGAIRQRTDIDSGHRIHDLLGVSLDLLRGFNAQALASHDDFFRAGRLR